MNRNIHDQHEPPPGSTLDTILEAFTKLISQSQIDMSKDVSEDSKRIRIEKAKIVQSGKSRPE